MGRQKRMVVPHSQRKKNKFSFSEEAFHNYLSCKLEVVGLRNSTKGQAENIASILLLIATFDKGKRVSMLNNRLLEKKGRRSYLSCEARLLPGGEKDGKQGSS